MKLAIYTWLKTAENPARFCKLVILFKHFPANMHSILNLLSFANYLHTIFTSIIQYSTLYSTFNVIVVEMWLK